MKPPLMLKKVKVWNIPSEKLEEAWKACSLKDFFNSSGLAIAMQKKNKRFSCKKFLHAFQTFHIEIFFMKRLSVLPFTTLSFLLIEWKYESLPEASGFNIFSINRDYLSWCFIYRSTWILNLMRTLHLKERGAAGKYVRTFQANVVKLFLNSHKRSLKDF